VALVLEVWLARLGDGELWLGEVLMGLVLLLVGELVGAGTSLVRCLRGLNLYQSIIHN
jgi:hypothetical protein